MGFQKRLLAGVREGAMEGPPLAMLRMQNT